MDESRDSQQSSAFPTEARLKQKEKQKRDKEAGIKPKKRPKVVEPGSDDCGEDLSGLGPDVAAYGADAFPKNISEKQGLSSQIYLQYFPLHLFDLNKSPTVGQQQK